MYFEPTDGGYHVQGATAAIEDGTSWVVNYEIDLDASWHTRGARIAGRSTAGPRRTMLEADSMGSWRINGKPEPHLGGCPDVNLESSAMTNTLPVHRIDLDVGEKAAAPAAYVRAIGLTVERLEQTYERVADDADRQRCHYAVPLFDFTCRLAYDHTGLVLDYPGIAVRAG